MVIVLSGTPSDSAAIMIISVRWPPPTSLEAETACTLPSLLMMICPVDGFPPAPWLQVWAAKPIPWKTPGRTCFALGACHLSFQPIPSRAATMTSRLPGLLKGFLVSGFPTSFRVFMLNSTAYLPNGYAACHVVISGVHRPVFVRTHADGMV